MVNLSDAALRLFNLSPYLHCVVGRDGYVQFANPAWTTTLGYTELELKACSIFEFIHPDDRERTLQECMLLLRQDQKITYFENRYRSKSGSYHWLAWGARSEDGVIYAIAKDVTQHKQASVQLEQTTTLLSHVLENSPGVFIKLVQSPSGDFLPAFISAQAAELFAVSADQLMQNPTLFLSMLAAEDREQLASLANEADTDAHATRYWEGPVVTLTGTKKWVKCQGRPRRTSEGEVCWDVVALDKTREHSVKLELEHQRSMTSHAARLAAIGELAANVGHEINNPLALVMGYSRQMARILRQNSIALPELDAALARQSEACDRIRKIVDGLRTVARREDGSEKARGNLTLAVSSTLGLVHDIYRHEALHLSLNLPEQDCLVTCPTEHVQQVLLNLLSNSRDATRGQKHREIRISVVDQGPFWRLLVQDNGPGIAESLRGKVFEPFYTSKGPSEGTGLGLSLCRTLIQAAGGGINFHSHLGAGTTFFVDLPKVEDQHCAVMPSADFDTVTQCRILLVDDEKEIRAVLRELLSERGCTVTTCESAMAGLQCAERMPFDIVISDIKMPGMNGVTFFEHLAANPMQAAAKRILISGWGTEDVASQLQAHPQCIIDVFLPKPFSEKQLTAALWGPTDAQVLRKAS